VVGWLKSIEAVDVSLRMFRSNPYRDESVRLKYFSYFCISWYILSEWEPLLTPMSPVSQPLNDDAYLIYRDKYPCPTSRCAVPSQTVCNHRVKQEEENQEIIRETPTVR
jgi:hypothetical protein